MEKLSVPNAAIPTVTFLNDRATKGADPGGICKATDRLGTGNRRAAFPAILGRGKTSAYDGIIWQHTIIVPPYTKAIGIRARGVCEIELQNPDDNAAFHYRWSTDGDWARYLVFNQIDHGADTTAYDDVVNLPWVGSIDTANENSTDIVSSPLPVLASESSQTLILMFKIETALAFQLYDYQLYAVPYSQAYPEV